jgi:predicted enzyme related to lactoylglutathione lyase
VFASHLPPRESGANDLRRVGSGSMATSNLMVVLYVHDMARAMRFYREVLALSVVATSPGCSVLACGAALVGLHMIEDGMSEGPAPFAGLNLEVDDLDRVVADTSQAGGRIKRIIDAQRPNLPVRVAELEDTEGNAFEVREYVLWSS